MQKLNSVSVGPVQALEVGDVIAFPFLGGVISGKITGIPVFARDLTEEQRAYLIENNIEIPSYGFHPIGGWSQLFVLGDFHDTSSKTSRDYIHHMFLNLNDNVAVFPSN